MKHNIFLRVAILIFWILQVSMSYGQGSINNLIFNSTDNIVGLDFSSEDGPALFYTGKKANATIGEGIAHAEKNGEIIFWVNSNGVFDKDYNLMPGSKVFWLIHLLPKLQFALFRVIQVNIIFSITTSFVRNFIILS